VYKTEQRYSYKGVPQIPLFTSTVILRSSPFEQPNPNTPRCISPQSLSSLLRLCPSLHLHLKLVSPPTYKPDFTPTRGAQSPALASSSILTKSILECAKTRPFPQPMDRSISIRTLFGELVSFKACRTCVYWCPIQFDSSISRVVRRIRPTTLTLVRTLPTYPGVWRNKSSRLRLYRRYWRHKLFNRSYDGYGDCYNAIRWPTLRHTYSMIHVMIVLDLIVTRYLDLNTLYIRASTFHVQPTNFTQRN
jgi:hypothetical protein